MHLSSLHHMINTDYNKFEQLGIIDSQISTNFISPIHSFTFSLDPKMSKTLAFISTILFLLTSKILSQHDQFIYNTFNQPDNNNPHPVSLNGVAGVDSDGILQLTNDTSRLIGRAFHPTPLLFKNSTNGSAFSFSTVFAFAVVPEYAKLGGHGFAFALTPNPLFPGAQPSQYLGILNASNVGNITNHIFAVEFDTVQDFEFGDINDNHIGININNMVSNKSVPAAYYDRSSNKVDINIKSGSTIQAWIDYDGGRKTISVAVSPLSTRPSTPILEYQFDLAPILQDRMHVGFSASTGLLASSHYLFAWSFAMNGAAASFDLSSLPSLPHPNHRNTTLLLTAVLSSVIVLMLAVFAAAYLFYRIKNADIIEPWELVVGPHRFSYRQLNHATKGFRTQELLGIGGFGKVYKGTLPGTKAEVAVKRISHESKQGLREFVAEIASIGRLRHRNLVQLQGWCRRRADLLLVYDYMPNGSLDKFLFSDDLQLDKPLLSWEQRFRILKGVASALLYLHEEWEHVVIHRDVKASNILLDGELNGRLGDFGLAKLHDHGANPSTTRVVGTLGYLAPELTRSGKVTTGSDVFAFGAVVLEVVSGRRPVEAKAPAEDLVLVDFIWRKWKEGKWEEVVDQRLGGRFDTREAEVAIKVGLMCSHPDAVTRPSMREVVRYLDGGDVMEVTDDGLIGGYEGRRKIGFDDFVHSYPSSVSWDSTGDGGSEGFGFRVARDMERAFASR